MSKGEALLESIFQVKKQDQPQGLRGILQTSDYDTFILLSDTGIKLHEFQGAKKANTCLPGDHVAWNSEQCELELRDEHPLIVGTIELTNKSKYGLTKRGIPMYLFTPYDKKYPHFIVGCSEKNTTQNMIGLIKFEKWSNGVLNGVLNGVPSVFPRGALQRILGPSGDFNAEREALIWQACPHKWPIYDYSPQQKESAQRTMLEGYTFNIDPEGCNDVDDVFTFEWIHDNTWQVTITISDVASYIEDGSPVDIMASLIGQTLYSLKGHVLRPMLPAAYSEETCSLKNGVHRYGVSLQFTWDGHSISQPVWLETMLTVDRSYTYDEFQEEDTAYNAVLQSITSYLAKETVTDAHKWVEHMMIFYNTEAGALLKKEGMGMLRKHSAPDVEKLERYKRYASESPSLLQSIQQLAFSSAEYCLAEEEDTVHYGLGAKEYAHASSPIRRYADLVNQRVLKRIIRKSGEYYIVPIAMYDMNQRMKATKRFARDMAFLEAISTGNTVFDGLIMEKIKLEANTVKVVIYVPEWKRMVSTTYQAISENTVLSRDEKTEIDVTDFREVTITCAFTPNARNWKERIVFHLA